MYCTIVGSCCCCPYTGCSAGDRHRWRSFWLRLPGNSVCWHIRTRTLRWQCRLINFRTKFKLTQLTSSHCSTNLNQTRILSVVTGFSKVCSTASCSILAFADSAFSETGYSISFCVVADLIKVQLFFPSIIISVGSSGGLIWVWKLLRVIT